MGYSKETERQNKVLGSLLKGETPEKRVMVGYEGKKEKLGDRISNLSKMWRLFGHCFDCQIEIENKMRIAGTYDEWEKEKIKQNKISFLKDSIQKIEEWKDMKAPEFYNQVGVNYPELEKEKWGGDMTQVNLMAEEALEEYTKVLNELEESK